jgi:hypothetical protein
MPGMMTCSARNTTAKPREITSAPTAHANPRHIHMPDTASAPSGKTSEGTKKSASVTPPTMLISDAAVSNAPWRLSTTGIRPAPVRISTLKGICPLNLRPYTAAFIAPPSERTFPEWSTCIARKDRVVKCAVASKLPSAYFAFIIRLVVRGGYWVENGPLHVAEQIAGDTPPDRIHSHPIERVLIDSTAST